LKQNIKTRTKAQPAFRSNVAPCFIASASGNITAAIRAKLLTSPARCNISKVGILILKKTLEIIATNLADVKAINQSKADQIELVTNLAQGGLSPNLHLVEQAVKISQLPIHVMLRPHYRNFVYTKNEFESILKYLNKITALTQAPQGIVFGSLTPKHQINEKQLQQIINYKKQYKLVFHRAFDELNDYQNGIETLNQYPEVDSLLTSGTKPKAINAIAELKHLVQLSRTATIMVGSGINIENIQTIANKTGATAFHVGTAVRTQNSIEGNIEIERINALKDLLNYR